MSTEVHSTPVIPENRIRNRLRSLRPLLWWFAFVFILFLLHTHEQLIERTRLKFSVSMQGRLLTYEAAAAVDGKPFSVAERIPLGWHTFTITHPKTESFSTNLFIWYGARDLGEIKLKRGMGFLALDVHPSAPILIIRGPDFSTTLTNSVGLTVLVPIDSYLIEAIYAHWQQRDEIHAFADMTNRHSIMPRLGALQLSCNQPDANFQVLTLEDQFVQGGAFPATILELPQGVYKLVAEHHQHRREDRLAIASGTTNDFAVTFKYGALDVETDPPGATVSTDTGAAWGTTPLSLTEVPVGTWNLNLRRDGYEPMRFALRIAEHETAAFRTNLVGRNFAADLRAARTYLAEGKYDRALEAAKGALAAKRNDPEAAELERQARGLERLARAEALGRESNYGAGINALETALKLLPDNARAQALLVDFKQRDAAQVEEGRRNEAIAKRERRPREYFEEWMKGTPNSGLFDQQEIKLKGRLEEIEAKVVGTLTNDKPVFKVQVQEHTEPDLLRVRVMLGLGAGGWRRCDLIAGQTSDGEVSIVFKVFEYSYPEGFSIRALVGANDEKDMLPIHSSRLSTQKSYLLKRRDEGVRLVRERIQQASQE